MAKSLLLTRPATLGGNQFSITDTSVIKAEPDAQNENASIIYKEKPDGELRYDQVTVASLSSATTSSSIGLFTKSDGNAIYLNVERISFTAEVLSKAVILFRDADEKGNRITLNTTMAATNTIIDASNAASSVDVTELEPEYAVLPESDTLNCGVGSVIRMTLTQSRTSAQFSNLPSGAGRKFIIDVDSYDFDFHSSYGTSKIAQTFVPNSDNEIVFTVFNAGSDATDNAEYWVLHTPPDPAPMKIISASSYDLLNLDMGRSLLFTHASPTIVLKDDLTKLGVFSAATSGGNLELDDDSGGSTLTKNTGTHVPQHGGVAIFHTTASNYTVSGTLITP